MSFLLRELFSFFAGRFAAKLLKRKLLIAYLRTLQIARASLLAAFLLFFALQVLIFGLIGLVVTGIWLLPITETADKLYVLLGFFGLIFTVPMIIFLLFFSERLWLKASGAEAMLEEQSNS